MRIVRGFFLHLGTLVPIVTYFVVLGAPPTVATVPAALRAATVASVCYLLVARAIGEAKQFDYGMLALFALGLAGVHLPGAPLLPLYLQYSGALVFLAFGLTALVPLVLRREPFTVHFARRQTPAWQQRQPAFAALNRLVAWWWVLVFFLGAVFAAAVPHDWRFTFLLPNLAVFLLGFPAAVWLPAVYLRRYPPPLPDDVEALLLGMPLVFDRRAAGEARARIQFRVSGEQAGAWWVRIERGRCAAFEGTTPEPDVVVHTPDGVWRRIVRGDLDGGQALAEGHLRVEGDVMVFAQMATWFPRR